MPSHGDPLDCAAVSAKCPIEASIYGYYPNLGVNAFFAALFAVFLFLNLLFGTYCKTWTYMLAMGLGCLAQVLGYIGRVLLHSNPFGQTGFEMQICCLTLAPAFNSAALYLVLKHLTLEFGPEWSRLRPKYYTWIFITFDFLALCFQGAGGGIAATAGHKNKLRGVGDDLMLTGITWQVATLLVFGVMVGDYIWKRWKSNVPLSEKARSTRYSPRFQAFVVALVVAYFAILIRCVYRIAEMSGGWSNPIMQTQGLFIGLDSCMVGLATLLQTVFHPGFCFPRLSKSVKQSSLEEDAVETQVMMDHDGRSPAQGLGYKETA